MQLIIATAALVATAAASNVDVQKSALDLMADYSTSLAHAKVVNRCSYPVYLWSIDKQWGCDAAVAMELKTGGIYQENLRNGTDGGISIKISKTDTCGGKDITQLEYKLAYEEGFAGNYLDMSFVDCTGNHEDCPGRTDGFYMKSGSQTGAFKSSVNNEHCPVFNVYNSEEAAKVSYINWDDRQTKFCNLGENLELYLCGGDAPGADDDYSSAAPSSEIESSSAQPTSSSSPSSSSEEAPAPSTTEDAYVVAAAAEITSAPVAAPPVVKTEVVYVTEYVNKRHAHGRRHQHFHA